MGLAIFKDRPSGSPHPHAKKDVEAPLSPFAFGYACSAMWFVLIVRDNTIGHGSINFHSLFYICFGAVCLLLVIIYFKRDPATGTIPAAPFYLTGLVSMLLSVTLLSLPVFDGSGAIAAIAAAIGALGACLNVFSWYAYMSSQPIRRGVVYVVGSYMLMFLLLPLMSFATSTILTVVLVMLPCISTYCLYRSIHSLPSMTPQDRSHVYYDRSSLRQFWKLLVAVAIYAIILTMRNTVDFKSNIPMNFLLFYLAFLLCGAVYCIFFTQGYVFLPEVLFKICLLLFATGFFIYPFVNGMTQDILADLFFIATLLIRLICILALVDIAGHASVHPFVIFGFWGACYGLPRAISLFYSFSLTNFPGSDASSSVPSLIAVYGIVVAVVFLLSERPVGLHPIFTELRHSIVDVVDFKSIDERCEELATVFNLTSREHEVISLVCKGRSKPYIADTLFVSENTVKAHTKNAYAKLGVHSKQELLNLIGLD